MKVLVAVAALAAIANAQYSWVMVEDSYSSTCFQPHIHWSNAVIQTCDASIVGSRYAANQWDLGNVVGSPVSGSASNWYYHGCKTPNQSPGDVSSGVFECQGSSCAPTNYDRADKEAWIGHIGRQMVRPTVMTENQDFE